MRDFSDFHSQLQSAVHMGSAIEYLLKFLLASESPLLVAEVRPPNVRSAIQWRIALSRNVYGSHLGDVKSCSIEDAFVLVQDILGLKILRLAELQAVTKARNAAIHLAIFPEPLEREDNLCTIISAFEYAAKRHSVAAFAATEREEMIAYSEQRMRVRYNAAQEKIRPQGGEPSRSSTSSEQVTQKYLVKQREFLDLQAEEIFGPDMHLWNGEFPTTRTYLCLRCGQSGVALCWAEGMQFDERTPGPGGLIDEDGGVGLSGMAFACSSCGLTLTPNELLALESKKDPWASDLLEPYPMTEEHYVSEPEPYTVKLLRADATDR
jgi:hypothetical protein